MSREQITIDGVPLESFGVTVHRVFGHRSPPAAPRPWRAVPGREDSLPTTREGATQPRQITVEAMQMAEDVADLQHARDHLLWYLERRDVVLRIVDTQGRFLRATVESHEIRPVDPYAIQRGHQVRLTLRATDPRWHDDAETVLDFTLAPAAVPLGTAPVRPVLTITGPCANPSVLYRDHAGRELCAMSFGVTLGAGERLIVDCDRLLVTNPAGDNLAHIWSGCRFWAFDPKHAGGPEGPWPTVEISPAPAKAEARYRRTWL